MIKKDEIQGLLKLEREKAQFQRELTLEQLEADLVKDYSMKQGTYKIIITIYEVNDLEPKSLKLWKLQLDQKTACDPFIEIQVGEQIKKTQIKKGTNNPIYDQQLYFQFDRMSVSELDRAKISFNVYDTKIWGMGPSLIGSFQLDWTNVYFKRNHEIYRSWLTLYDSTNQFQGPVGYILANIAVLGQYDQITVHDSAFIKDPLVTIQDTITSPKLPLMDFSISIQLFRAQNLVPISLLSRQVRAYVIAKYSGNKIKSSTVKSLSPEWNQCLKIGTQVPNKSKYLTLQVRNKNYVGADDLIGILKIPFIDLCSLDESVPTWGHLYGPSMSGKDSQPFNYASKMQIYGDKIGSHYRGRLLYKVIGKKDQFTKNIKNKMIFKFPFRVVPVIPLKLYLLRIDLIEGFGLPIIKQKQCCIHVSIGQYLIKSKFHTLQSDMCQFFEELQEKKVNLTEDPNSMPDLVIYLCNGLDEQNRIGYVRIKASQLIRHNIDTQSARTYELKSDKSLFPKFNCGTCGFITARISLYSSQNNPPKRKKLLQKMKEKENMVFKVFLYRGQRFPAANDSGDCDPKIKFSMNGKQFTSKPIMSTYNPIWNQVYTEQIKMQNIFKVDLEKSLVCNAYDHQDNGRDNYIGSFCVKINQTMKRKVWLPMKNKQNKQIQVIYSKPKWYTVINPNIEVGNNAFGRVLISCGLFQKEYKFQKQGCYAITPYFNSISTQSFSKSINLFIIGIRQIKADNTQDVIQILKSGFRPKKELDHVKIIPQISMNCENNLQKANLKSYTLKNRGCQINQIYQFKNIQVPKNKSLSTFMDIRVKNARNQHIYGSNSIDLRKFKDFSTQQSGNINEQKDDKILNVEQLERNIQKLKAYKKIQQQKIDAMESAKYISKKRKQTYQTKNMIPPDQIQTHINKQKQDPQTQVEMDRMLREFERDFQTDKGNELGYIKNLMGNSSNNSLDQSLKDGYNLIDEQAIKLNLFAPGQKASNQINKKDSQNQGMKLQIQQEEYSLQQSNYRADSTFPETKEFGFKDKGKKRGLILDIPNQQGTNNQLVSGLRKSEIGHIQSTIQAGFKKQKGPLNNFDLMETLTLSDRQYTEKAIQYKNVEKDMRLQSKHQQEAIKRNQQYKYAAAVKLSLFKWMRREETKQTETYQDYDTDQEQNLDIIPEWYKGRTVLKNDLEKIFHDNRTIQNIQVFRGRKIDQLQTRVKEQVGIMKMVFISGDAEKDIKNSAQYYRSLLKPKQYFCRFYILKGKSLMNNTQKKPTTYLRVIYRDKVTVYSQTTVKDENNPQYYICHEQAIVLPGSSTIRIEVIQVKYLVSTFGDNLKRDVVLGYTQIDVEDRYFMRKWHLFDKKPIQLRNLYSQYGIGTQGRLEVWVDLIEKKKWLVNPVIKISPPPWDQFELRVVVWATKQCVFKNQKTQSNDIFVRGQIGGRTFQETDVHWNCRSIGSFNYRFKFPVFYPPKPEDMYSDVFIVQIWDKDVIGYNNLIGEARINLNQMHRIIEKAVKRKKPVCASKKIIEKNLAITDKFWFDVFNHREKNQFGQLQSQGKVQLSFQLVPTEEAKAQRANGYGRTQPNVYPTLEEPTGRMTFNYLQPFAYLKQLLGPNLYKEVCIKCGCFLLLAIIILLLVLFGSSLIAVIVGT